MVKYELMVSGEKITLALDVSDPNARAELIFTGNPESISTFQFWIEKQYGAFGHLIGKVASPIDLDYVMSRPDALQFNPLLVEGQNIVVKYDPKIPKGSIT